jgi:hypothetical protein
MRHGREISATRFSADGRLLMTASGDNTVRLWDAATGDEIGQPLTHPLGVYSADISPDGRRVATATYSSDLGTARVWDVLLGSDSVDDANRLADLAEVVGGYRVNELGSVMVLDETQRRERVGRLLGPKANGFVTLESLLRRFSIP